MEVFFVRHGLAESNLDYSDRNVGDFAGLVEAGRRQIAAAAKELGRLASFEVVYTSPKPRAVQSAEIIGNTLDAEIMVESKLDEISKGQWQGLPVQRVIELENQIDIKQRHTFRPPDGENWADVGARVAAFVLELRDNNCQRVILVSHDHPIRMGVGALTGQPIENWEDMEVGNGSIIRLAYRRGLWQLD